MPSQLIILMTSALAPCHLALNPCLVFIGLGSVRLALHVNLLFPFTNRPSLVKYFNAKQSKSSIQPLHSAALLQRSIKYSACCCRCSLSELKGGAC